MALDTFSKRLGMLGFNAVGYPLPIPDGEIDKADRHLFLGIVLPATLPTSGAEFSFIVKGKLTDFTVKGKELAFIVPGKLTDFEA